MDKWTPSKPDRFKYSFFLSTEHILSYEQFAFMRDTSYLSDEISRMPNSGKYNMYI